MCADFALKCRTDPKSRRPTYHGNSLERGGRSDKCDGSAEELQVSGDQLDGDFPEQEEKRERKNSEEQKAAGVTLPVTTEPKRRREEKRQT